MTREAISVGGKPPSDVKSASWWLFTFTDASCRAAKPDAVYDAAMEAVHGAIGCDRVAIFLLEDPTGEADFVAWRGLSEGFRATMQRCFPWRENTAAAEPVYVENIVDWNVADALKAAAADEGVHSLAFIPFVAQGGVKGGLVICFDAPHSYAETERIFALVIARQFGFSLERMAAEKARASAEEKLLYLAAMVESSDDAIVTKNLDGVITSWNSGAERLFGFSAAEAVGKSITIIIPEERREEERTILARLRSGERISHFETVRRRSDGGLIDISLTVSPVKDPSGNVIGASKIARDISERRRAAEQQDLLLREMHHRVRNLFALASTIVTMTARRAKSIEQLAETACRRLQALAAAQTLTMRPLATGQHSTSLRALLDAVLKPFKTSLDDSNGSISVTGDDAELTDKAATALALVIHELATNAMKYGGLSPGGRGVVVACRVNDDRVEISWGELGVSQGSGGAEGFGSKLISTTIEHQLSGRFRIAWDQDGLNVFIELPAAKLREL